VEDDFVGAIVRGPTTRFFVCAAEDFCTEEGALRTAIGAVDFGLDLRAPCAISSTCSFDFEQGGRFVCSGRGFVMEGRLIAEQVTSSD